MTRPSPLTRRHSLFLFFGRELVTRLPPPISVGVVNVSIGGGKIGRFEKGTYPAYVATAPRWMTPTIARYGGNPCAHLVPMARIAQRDGVIMGILLHQGESNSGDPDWPRKVKGICENLLPLLGFPPSDSPQAPRP
jgi:hypothetical protein